MMVVSKEEKQCQLLQILTVLNHAANQAGDNTVEKYSTYLRMQIMLKYFTHLKVKEKWEVCDIAKIQDTHLLAIARHLKPNYYKYLIPFCANPETLFAALQQDPAYHFRSLPLIRFANRMPKHNFPMKPIEEVIDGLNEIGAEADPDDFEYYFDDPKALHEIGIYESRYSGQECSVAYSDLCEYACYIIENYPMKDSGFEKASVGLELLQRRVKSRKI
jgi:hypothetical protein